MKMTGKLMKHRGTGQQDSLVYEGDHMIALYKDWRKYDYD